jgi:hypothetical protein
LAIKTKQALKRKMVLSYDIMEFSNSNERLAAKESSDARIAEAKTNADLTELYIDKIKEFAA